MTLVPNTLLERLKQELEAFRLFQPLGRATRQALLAWAPAHAPEYSEEAVFAAAAQHVSSREYLRALLPGAARVDLSGRPTGEVVSSKEAQQALEKLRAMPEFRVVRSKNNRNVITLVDFASAVHLDTTGLQELSVRLVGEDLSLELPMSPKGFRRAQRFCLQHPDCRVYAKQSEFKGTGRLGLYCLKGQGPISVEQASAVA